MKPDRSTYQRLKTQTDGEHDSMNRLLPWLLIAAISVTGCGTLFNSKLKTISMSPTPTEAEVWIDGTMRGTTPSVPGLDNQRSCTVVFKKESPADVACELRRTRVPGRLSSTILGGLLPVIVDAATRGWNGIGQDVCNVTLPCAPADATDSGLTRLAREKRVGHAPVGRAETSPRSPRGYVARRSSALPTAGSAV